MTGIIGGPESGLEMMCRLPLGYLAACLTLIALYPTLSFAPWPATPW